MAETQEQKQRIQRIEELIRQVEGIPDLGVRVTVHSLVESLMELHGATLSRILDIAADCGEEGTRFVDKLGSDELTGGMLVLYGLHPSPLEARVHQALEQVRARLRSSGARIDLLGIEAGSVRIRIRIDGNGNARQDESFRSAVEESIYAVAPDVASLSIEIPGSPAGFVPLETLMRTASTNGRDAETIATATPAGAP
jgi:hypothetical protein